MKDKFILNDCNYIKSNNFDERDTKVLIDTIILHCISLPEGKYDNDNVIEFFTNKLDYNKHPSFDDLRDLKVSSHLFIRRSGEIIQFVPFNKKAWHAGKSHYKGRSNYNDFSIGIELEGSVKDSYTNEQYNKLKNCIFILKELFPSIQDNNILGHSDIAPGRKTDPGSNFSWERIL
tara:strand:+ start:4793 stop:5320 length:528 start_codon:yes stop_codon:yes gene_type:complete